jgi:transposase
MQLSLHGESMSTREESGKLFDELPVSGPGAGEMSAAKGAARVLMPTNRKQLEFRHSDLDSLLPEGHRARLVWGYVERQDLGGLYARIKAREGGAGRPTIAPEILFALWLYATLDGVGSGREVARLSEEHDAYRWICGGVQVNYHTVCDFRVEHGQALDELLSANVAGLMAAGVVKLKRVAQDGMRVRASAGTGSFRREEKLAGYLEEAKREVERLKRELQADPGARCCRADYFTRYFSRNFIASYSQPYRNARPILQDSF